MENTLTEVLKAQSVEKEKKLEVKSLRQEIDDLGVQLDQNIGTVHKKQPKYGDPEQIFSALQFLIMNFLASLNYY